MCYNLKDDTPKCLKRFNDQKRKEREAWKGRYSIFDENIFIIYSKQQKGNHKCSSSDIYFNFVNMRSCAEQPPVTGTEAKGPVRVNCSKKENKNKPNNNSNNNNNRAG